MCVCVCVWKCGRHSELIWGFFNRMCHILDLMWELHCRPVFIAATKRVDWVNASRHPSMKCRECIHLSVQKKEEGKKMIRNLFTIVLQSNELFRQSDAAFIYSLQSTGKWFQYLPITSLLFIIWYIQGSIHCYWYVGSSNYVLRGLWFIIWIGFHTVIASK